jgi:hypothetical protein
MKWMLLFYVLTGETHGLQTEMFISKTACDQAALHIVESTQLWGKAWRPKPICLHIGSNVK